LSAGLWKNAVLRNRKKIEWQIWAQEKYRRIAQDRAARVEDRKSHSPVALASP